jgi:hypothetical protein
MTAVASKRSLHGGGGDSIRGKQKLGSDSSRKVGPEFIF